MLVCALCILPVVFSTQLGTRFEINDKFFTSLSQATTKVTKIETVNGKPKAVEATESVPVATIASLKSLSGKTFASAKEFLAATAGVIGQDTVNRFDGPLVESARSDNNYWIAVFLIPLAPAGHQAGSPTVFPLHSPFFPKSPTASAPA